MGLMNITFSCSILLAAERTESPFPWRILSNNSGESTGKVHVHLENRAFAARFSCLTSFMTSPRHVSLLTSLLLHTIATAAGLSRLVRCIRHGEALGAGKPPTRRANAQFETHLVGVQWRPSVVDQRKLLGAARGPSPRARTGRTTAEETGTTVSSCKRSNEVFFVPEPLG